MPIVANQNAEEVLVASTGNVYTAPWNDSLTYPEDITDSIDGAFIPVGFISEDGVTFADAPNIQDIPAWQSRYPIRKVKQGEDTKLEFVMRQWNAENIKLAFGGGEVLPAGSGSVYVPPGPAEIDTRALIATWADDERNYMLVAPRGLVSGEVSSQLVRSGPADLAISFALTPLTEPQDDSGGDPILSTQPYYILTDDPAFSAS